MFLASPHRIVGERRRASRPSRSPRRGSASSTPRAADARSTPARCRLVIATPSSWRSAKPWTATSAAPPASPPSEAACSTSIATTSTPAAQILRGRRLHHRRVQRLNAMGYGKEAARSIDRHLTGEARFDSIFPAFEYDQAPPELSPCARHHAHFLPAAVRAKIVRGGGIGTAAGRGAWKRPAAACAATSAKPSRMPSPRRIGSNSLCLSKSRFVSTANFAPPREGQTILAGGAGEWTQHPVAVLPGRPERRRILPPVPGRGLRHRPPAAGLHHARAERHVGHHQLRKPRAQPADGAGAAVHRAQPCLLRLRLQRPLRTAVAGADAGRHACPLPYNFPRLPVDVSHPRWVLDHNRCILCSRCVRVCDEIEGAHVWDISARGINSMLVAELNRPGASRSPAPAAANACRSARPAHWWRKARRSRR